MDSWHQLGHCDSKKQHWGIRRTPKTVVVKELKPTSRGLPCEEDPSLEKFDDGWTEVKMTANLLTQTQMVLFLVAKSSVGANSCYSVISHRHAFYGHWPRKRYKMMFLIIYYL